MKNGIYLLPAVLLGLCANPVQADERYIFDKTHTAIAFSVNRLGLFPVTGEFSKYDGDFVFCIQHPDKDAIAITLYTADIHTSGEWIGEELRNSDFFYTAQFPQMRFVSTAVKLVNKNNATVTGNLTLLGVTRPVTLDAHFTQKAHDPDSGDYVVSFSASAVIKRSEFGMTHLIPIIGDEVRLHIKVKGIEESPGIKH